MADKESPFLIEDPEMLNFCINGWQSAVTCVGFRQHIFQIEDRYSLTRFKSDDYGVRVCFEGRDHVAQANVEIEKLCNIFENELGLSTLRQLQIHRALKSCNGIRKIINIMIPVAVAAALEEEEEVQNFEFDDVYLVYASTSDLYDLLFNNPDQNSGTLESITMELPKQLRDTHEDKIAHNFWQLVKAVLQLHLSNIVHGSLDHSSLGVSLDTKVVQVYNFIWSLPEDEPYSYPDEPDEEIRRSILSFTPPEILLGSHGYNKASFDIWCLGLILIDMLNGGGEPLLFIPTGKAANEENQLVHILHTLKPAVEDLFFTPKEASSMLKILHEYTTEASSTMKKEENPLYGLTYADDLSVDLAMKMLRFDPAKRITAQEALQHPYIYREVQHPEEPVERKEVASLSCQLQLAGNSLDRDQIRDFIWEEMLDFHFQDLL